MPARKPSLMLVDDHPLWRETIRKVLDRRRVGNVVAEASDGDEALSKSKLTKPDVVVMDIDLPKSNGIVATRRLLEARPDTKVLVLSASDRKSQVIEAVEAGASGYLLKTSTSDEIVEAIRKVYAGDLVFPASVAEAIRDELLIGSETHPKAITLVVADDAALRREGLTHVLEKRGFTVAASNSLRHIREVLEENDADVVIVTLGGKGRKPNLLSEVQSLRGRADGERGILVLAEKPNTTEAAQLITKGSRGIGYYGTESISDANQLTDAIQRLARGETVLDPSLVSQLVERPRTSDVLADLTEGERKVLALMAEGRSNRAVSERLVLSLKTVEARVAGIFSKLGLEQTTDDSRRVLAVLTYLRTIEGQPGDE